MRLRVCGAGMRGLAIASLLIVSFSLVACALTRRTRSASESGFLVDYSELVRGERDEVQLLYINPDADFSKYDAMMIESVSIWHNEETTRLSARDQQALTNYLYTALRDELSQDYRIVGAPAPNALHLRAAITEAKGARVAGNAITTVIPATRLVSIVAGLATDTQVFVGKAAIEVELLDSTTGERLGAAVDERAGGKTLRGIGGKWKDVDNAFDYWAQRLRERLASLREAGAKAPTS